MKKYSLNLIALLFITSASLAFAQKPDAAKTNGNLPAESIIPAPPAITPNSTPLELARAAVLALGGDKFKNVKSTMLVGDVNVYMAGSAQSMPAKFAIVTVGDKLRIDINAGMYKLKEVFDGRQSFSSMPGWELPPANKFGLQVLAKYDQPGYMVSALPDKKKLRGIRIADSDGNTTDFYIDPANGRVMQYIIPYNGYTFGTENSKFIEVEGVLVASSFSQRVDGKMGAVFLEYKVKDAKLNQPIGDDVFTIE